MINKRKFSIKNDKKLLHKIGKKWVVVSAFLLMALGAASAMTTVSTHAEENVNNSSNQVAERETPTKALTGFTVAGSSTTSQKTRESPVTALVITTNSSQITATANGVHSNLVQNAELNASKMNSTTGTSDNAQNSSAKVTPTSNDDNQSSKVSNGTGQQSNPNIPASAPIYQHKSIDPNSPYGKYLAQMGQTDAQVQKANQMSTPDNDAQKKPLLGASDWFSGSITNAGNDDGLDYKVWNGNAVEFTGGTPNADLNGFSSNSDVANAKAIKFDSDIDTTNVTDANMKDMFSNASNLQSITITSQKTKLLSSSMPQGINHSTNAIRVLAHMTSAEKADINNIASSISTNASISDWTPSNMSAIAGLWGEGSIDAGDVGNLESFGLSQSEAQDVIAVSLGTRTGAHSFYQEVGNGYTLTTPNDFSKGNVGMFVAKAHPKLHNYMTTTVVPSDIYGSVDGLTLPKLEISSDNGQTFKPMTSDTVSSVNGDTYIVRVPYDSKTNSGWVIAPSKLKTANEQDTTFDLSASSSKAMDLNNTKAVTFNSNQPKQTVDIVPVMDNMTYKFNKSTGELEFTGGTAPNKLTGLLSNRADIKAIVFDNAVKFGKITNAISMFANDQNLQSVTFPKDFDTTGIVTGFMFRVDRNLNMLTIQSPNTVFSGKGLPFRRTFMLSPTYKFKDGSVAYHQETIGANNSPEVSDTVTNLADGNSHVGTFVNNSNEAVPVMSDTVSFQSDGNLVSSTKEHGIEYTPSKIVTAPNGYELVDPSDDEFIFDGSTHTFPIKQVPVTDTVAFHDIYGDIDGLTAPTNQSETGGYYDKYTVSAPSGWALVNPDGSIANGTNNVADDNKTFDYNKGNQTLDVAPVYDGMTYKYDKANNNVEFVNGTADSNLSNFSSNSLIKNAKSLKFDNGVTTNDVTKMNNMFNGDTKLQSLDLGTNFDTGDVSDMSDMFANDGNLHTLTLPSTFNTGSKMPSMNGMFSNTPITELTVNSVNTKLASDSTTKLQPLYKEMSVDNSYTVSTPNDFTKGNVGTFIRPAKPITVTFKDIYSDTDGLTAPVRVTESGADSNNEYTINSDDLKSINNGKTIQWVLVNPDGTIADNSETFGYSNGSQTLDVAPVYDGMTYKYDKTANSVEFVNGTANGDLSNFSSDSFVKNAKSITFDGGINTSNVINMSNMFNGDANLQSIDLGTNFDTSNVTNMDGMFANDGALQSLVLPSSFNTRKFKGNKSVHMSMRYMFGNDKSLTSLTLSSDFYTGNVDDMSGMFSDDDALQSITIKALQGCWFYASTEVPTMYEETGFNDNKGDPLTLGVANNFSDGNPGTFTTKENAKPVDIYGPSDGLKVPNFSDLRTNHNWAYVDAQGNLLNEMAVNANGTIRIAPIYDGMTYKYDKANNSVEFMKGTPNTDLSDFINNTKSATSDNPESVISKANVISFSNDIDTSKVTNMHNMFADDKNLISINLGDTFNTSNVTDMSGMFANDQGISTLDLPSEFTTDHVTNMSGMFAGDDSNPSQYYLRVLNIDNDNHVRFDTSVGLPTTKMWQLDQSNSYSMSKAQASPKQYYIYIMTNSNLPKGSYVVPPAITVFYMYKNNPVGNEIKSLPDKGDYNYQLKLSELALPKGYQFTSSDKTNEKNEPVVTPAGPNAHGFNLINIRNEISHPSDLKVNVEPTPGTITVNYINKANNTTISHVQLTGNAVGGPVLSDTSVTIDKNYAPGLSGYLVMSSDTLPFVNGQTYTVYVGKTDKATISFNNESNPGESFANITLSGADGTSTSVVAPDNYHFASSTSIAFSNANENYSFGVYGNSYNNKIIYEYKEPEGSTTTSGAYATSSNWTSTTGLSSGWHLVKPNNSFTYGTNGSEIDVPVAPNTINDTVKYRVSDNHNYAKAGLVLNSFSSQINDNRATDADNTSLSVNSSNHPNLPAGYSLSGSYSFSHSTNAVSSNANDVATIVPDSESLTVDFNNGDYTVSNATYSGYMDNSSSASAPSNYHYPSGSTGTFTYSAYSNSSSTTSFAVIPNTESLTVEYSNVDPNGVIIENSTRSIASQVSVPYAQSYSDVTKLYAVPNGYHFVNGNKNYKVTAAPGQKVVLKIAGNLESGNVEVTVVKYDRGQLINSSTEDIPVSGAVGTNYSLRPAAYTPSGYAPRSTSVQSGEFIPSGINNSIMTFDYDAQPGSAVTVDYVNQNGSTVASGTITGNVDDQGSIGSKVSVPSNYSVNVGQPNQYYVTTSPQTVKINVTGKSMTDTINYQYAGHSMGSSTATGDYDNSFAVTTVPTQASGYTLASGQNLSFMYDGASHDVQLSYDFQPDISSANSAVTSAANVNVNMPSANSISAVASGYAKSASADANLSAITSQASMDNSYYGQASSLNSQLSSAQVATKSYAVDVSNDAKNSNVTQASIDVSLASSAASVASGFASQANSIISEMNDNVKPSASAPVIPWTSVSSSSKASSAAVPVIHHHTLPAHHEGHVTNQGYPITYDYDHKGHDTVAYHGHQYRVHYHNNGKNTIHILSNHKYKDVLVSTALPTNNVSSDLIQAINHVDFNKPSIYVKSAKKLHAVLNLIAPKQVVEYHHTKMVRIKVPSHFRYFMIRKQTLAHLLIMSVGKVDTKRVLKPHRGLTLKIDRIIVVHGKHKNYVRYQFSVDHHKFWVTARRDYVPNAYWQKHDFAKHAIHMVKVIQNCRLYASSHYNHRTFVKNVRAEDVFPVARVIFIGHKGYYQTRLQLTNGKYITANRNFVKII